MQDRFEQYDNSIDPAGADYWYDHALPLAIELLWQFKHSDWTRLRQALSFRSVSWLCRCAETLEEVYAASSLDILKELLCHPEDRVAVAAVDALKGWALAGQIISSDAVMLQRLSKLHAKPELECRYAVELLQAKLCASSD
ncbi:hypothetical protein [Leeia aquatica]|uniref:HEAT repeat domain-containing protein n=1 Tax=Leeia aquatica TaxID=2725557 RepID=A0A847SDY6_9NEIS|nr:hypothetical protein [Leeia aquatica]NLR74162.1 hypothetical protein [Leeia aquatica]